MFDQAAMLNCFYTFCFLTLVTVSIIDLCSSACSTVNSKVHGKLTLSKNENIHQNCVGDLTFLKEETGQIFCLKKGGKSDTITCVDTAACFCGQENKPALDLAEIAGGDEVEENQYPWHALVYNKQGKKLKLGQKQCRRKKEDRGPAAPLLRQNPMFGGLLMLLLMMLLLLLLVMLSIVLTMASCACNIFYSVG